VCGGDKNHNEKVNEEQMMHSFTNSTFHIAMPELLMVHIAQYKQT